MNSHRKLSPCLRSPLRWAWSSCSRAQTWTCSWKQTHSLHASNRALWAACNSGDGMHRGMRNWGLGVYVPEDWSRRSWTSEPPLTCMTCESAHVTWKSRAKSAGLAIAGWSWESRANSRAKPKTTWGWRAPIAIAPFWAQWRLQWPVLLFIDRLVELAT